MIIKKKYWQNNILNWYNKNKRQLPWRKKNNQNFYSIWLSEVMLQQTQVKTVIPYFLKFKNKWSSLKSFSDATLDEILFLWQGMGYYRRATNIYKTLQILKKKKLKEITYDSLLELPGIGDYTASSITAILNDNNKAVIDGNIKRVISRAFNISTTSRKSLEKIRQKAQALTPEFGNKDYCQALMDLGSIICKPKNPNCFLCPVNKLCSFTKLKKKTIISNKKNIITKIGAVFFIKAKEYVFIQKSDDGLLKGLMKFPTTEFFIENKSIDLIKFLRELTKKWISNNILNIKHENLGMIKHKFSHFELKLLVVKILINNKNKISLKGIWIKEKCFKNYAFSKLMVKVKEKYEKKNEYFN